MCVHMQVPMDILRAANIRLMQTIIPHAAATKSHWTDEAEKRFLLQKSRFGKRLLLASLLFVSAVIRLEQIDEVRQGPHAHSEVVLGA